MAMRFGVVGCGVAGQDFAAAVLDLPDARIVTAYDPDPTRLQPYAARVGARMARAAHDVAADPLVDAVYLATPHHDLAPLAIAALDAGRHVLVEKPAARTPAELDELEAAAGRAGRALGIMYVLRQDPAVRLVRRLLDDRALGRLRQIRIQTVIDKPDDYWVPWRVERATSGGGVLLMNSSHQLDTVRFVTGLDFTSVVAEVAPDDGVEHWAGAVYRMTGDVVVSLAASARSPGADQQERVEIDGDDGRLEFGGRRDAVRIHLRSARRDVPARRWTELPVEHRRLYRATVADFVRAVWDEHAPAATAADARAVLRAVTGAYDAARLGTRVPLA